MKYTPGLIVGQLSGKAGSTVASRNKAGSYLKAKTTPKLVRSPLAEAVRSSLSAISSAWRTLTDAQRLGWTALGAGISRTDSLGNSYTLTGAQAHELVNRNLFTLSLPYVPDAPALSDPGALTDIFLDAVYTPSSSTTVTVGATSATQNVGSTAGMAPGQAVTFGASPGLSTVESITDPTHVVLTTSITTVTADPVTWDAQTALVLSWDPTPLPAHIYLQVKATPALSAGINRPSAGAFRTLQIYPPTNTSPTTPTRTYAQTFGPANAGSKIFLQGTLLTDTGFQGQPASTSIVVGSL